MDICVLATQSPCPCLHGVDHVTPKRPDSPNALDPALIDALDDYFQKMQRDRDTRVIVLKGAGANFCAGLDLKSAVARRKTAGAAGRHRVFGFAALHRRHCDADATLPATYHSALKRCRSRGGFALALAADIRIATKNARMNCAFIKLGLGGCEIGSSYFLTRLVGVSVASELILTGRLSGRLERSR